VTDSDDDMNGAAPRPDTLRYYDIEYIKGAWYLQNFYGTNSVWYIGGVQSLGMLPLTVPEPTTIGLLVMGSLIFMTNKKHEAAYFKAFIVISQRR
jgi:hypothetical protein